MLPARHKRPCSCSRAQPSIHRHRQPTRCHNPAPSYLQGAKPVPFLAAVGLGLVLRFLVPIPVGITVQAWTLLSIFVSTIAGGVVCRWGCWRMGRGHLARHAAALGSLEQQPAAGCGCIAACGIREHPRPFLPNSTPPTLPPPGLVLEPLPVGAWAFLSVTTAIATKTLPFAAAFSAFTNDVIWLIVVSFFFARVGCN